MPESNLSPSSFPDSYQDHTTWRGGNLKQFELDLQLNPVGNGGKRYVLLNPPDDPPLNDRFRGGEFYFENGKNYLYCSASMNPRLIVFATADVDEPGPNGLESLRRPGDGSASGLAQFDWTAPATEIQAIMADRSSAAPA